MNIVVQSCEELKQEDIAFLDKIAGDMGLLADLSRADVFLYCSCSPDAALVAAQARPHSILPIYGDSLLEHKVTAEEEPGVLRTMADGRRSVMEVRRQVGSRHPTAKGAAIMQETLPVRARDGRVIGVLSIETNLIEHERHRRRNRDYQRALRLFQESVAAGHLRGAEDLTPFSEHDGLLVLDAEKQIVYASSIATSLYHKLGHTGDLLGTCLEDLERVDTTMVEEAMNHGRCVERELRVGDMVWIKKAVPFFAQKRRLGGLLPAEGASRRLEGVLVLIHDATEARRQKEELQVKVAMIQEIHHRVKNNMQTIASLLRLQARRSESEEVRRALQEGINRILSVAVIHEFLAHQEARVINIRDVAQRIIKQIQEGVLDADRHIRLDLKGPNIYLPTQSATVCALVVNELLLNALEHGYVRQEGGTVTVNLSDDGERIAIAVDDDGVGLPKEFDLDQTDSLGLMIVRTLAEGDLKGHFELRGRDQGVSAVVTFPKQT